LGELIISDFSQLEKIDVSGFESKENLTQLQINNCSQLIELNCKLNKLTELIIANCPNLKKINVWNNQLTNLDLSNNQQLEDLCIRGNNFSSDLSFLSDLVNLKKLNLSMNPFTGSLEPLYNCRELEELDISDTDISYGLEYLPKIVKKIECSFEIESKVSDIWEELQPFNGDIKK